MRYNIAHLEAEAERGEAAMTANLQHEPQLKRNLWKKAARAQHEVEDPAPCGGFATRQVVGKKVNGEVVSHINTAEVEEVGML
jgi:hypothetical protein